MNINKHLNAGLFVVLYAQNNAYYRVYRGSNNIINIWYAYTV